jgi:hypothetical protein
LLVKFVSSSMEIIKLQMVMEAKPQMPPSTMNPLTNPSCHLRGTEVWGPLVSSKQSDESDTPFPDRSQGYL